MLHHLESHFSDTESGIGEASAGLTSGTGIDIRSAQDGMQEMLGMLYESGEGRGAIIKQITWREDAAGLDYLQACVHWMNSGGMLYVLKDEKGIPFSLSESSYGDALSPEPSTWNRCKGKLARSFYDNKPNIQNLDITQEFSEVRDEFMTHKNLVIDNSVRYDHSKLLLTFDIKTKQPLRAIFGGVSIGNEWSYRGSGSKQYVDSVTDINDRKVLHTLVQDLAGNSTGWQDGVCVLTRANYHDQVSSLMSHNTSNIRLGISYVGDTKDMFQYDSNRKVEMILSRESNTNRWRNIHFLYELLRRMNKGFPGGLRGCNSLGTLLSYWKDFCTTSTEQIPEGMRVIFLESVLHMKAIAGDDFAVIGSGNLVEKGYGELGIAFQGGVSDKADNVIVQVNQSLDGIIEGQKSLRGENLGIRKKLITSDLHSDSTISFSLLRSQIEHMVMAIESWSIQLQPGLIKGIQGKEESLFQTLFDI